VDTLRISRATVSGGESTVLICESANLQELQFQEVELQFQGKKRSFDGMRRLAFAKNCRADSGL